jgi:RNA polymerase sigma-70 factor (ECF subfamily)
MEMTDVTAVSRAMEGDSDAFRLLVERHSRAVFRVAYRMTGNEHDADDVVQETFLRVYRQLESFESRANFTTWLHRIAVNCSLDLLRTRQRHDKHRSNDSEEALMNGDLATSEPHAERLLLSTEVRHQVSTALESLSGNERTAFVLRHFEGMSIEEIGSVLGTRVNATKNTIFRAVRKLRDQLEPLVRTTSCNT